MSTNVMKLKDPGSAITHFIGAVAAIIAAAPLLTKAAHKTDKIYLISFAVYIGSLILLYSASTIYHSLDISEKINKRLKKFDHMMISVMIAGSYTPICLLVLKGRIGSTLLTIVWSLAMIGILIKVFWIYCPKWFSSILYIAMGWTCILALPTIYAKLSTPAFIWLLVGGIIYTIGGIIYGLKLNVFNKKHQNFGSHEIFHLFVMAGSACHFVVMYVYLLG